MFLAVGSVSEFVKVVQIVCWIALPVFTVVTALIVYQHYRKVRRNREEALSAGDLPTPAAMAQLNKEADFILFDHTGLVDQYHHKLCHSEARYAALQHKYAALQVKCAAMAVFAAGGQTASSNISSYTVLKREVDRFIKKYHTERKRSETIHDQLLYTNQQLEKENERLRATLESLATNPTPQFLSPATENVA
jgi:phosphate/sulfate permease